MRPNINTGEQRKDPNRTKRPVLTAFVWLLFLIFLERRVRYAWVPASPLLGLLFFLTELVCASGFVGFLITQFNGRKSIDEPTLPQADLSVDVFIPTLNEDVALLRRTIRRALAIRYPHQTCLLDDGNRAEVKALAAELGCRYLTRGDREQGGKAGNLNAALEATSGPFVLVLDADAFAHETILERTLGYFRDPQLAFVQTPQVYSNVDAFEVSYDPVKRTYWSASDLFQFDLQRGFAQLDSALCVGSGFVFRRSAVVGAGGFRTQLAGEDVRLSLDLHMSGWRSLYVDEVLALHLAPDGLGPYWTQQVRWARGTQQLLRRLFVTTQLSLAQRLAYSQVASGYLLELLRVLFRIVPVLSAVRGVAVLGPDSGEDMMFLSVYIAWFGAQYLTPVLLSNGRMRPTIRNAFTLLRAGPGLAAIWHVLVQKRFRFVVTPKGAGARAPRAAYMLPVAAVVIGGAASIIGIAYLVVKPNFAFLAVTLFNVESFVAGSMAMWITRGRTLSHDVNTTIVQRQASLRLNADGDGAKSLEIVRLGVNRAILVAPLDMHAGSGVLRFVLDDGAYELPGLLRHAPNRIVPRITVQHTCYEFLFELPGRDRDRLADQIDGREFWRFLGSLRNYPHRLPPGIDCIGSGMAYYPLRPRTPSFRF